MRSKVPLSQLADLVRAGGPVPVLRFELYACASCLGKKASPMISAAAWRNSLSSSK